MQEALQTAGYKLPKYGADGKFGDETVKALKKFQTDHCLKDTGRLDKQTMEQLSIASTKFPEYDKLFADGKLNTTIAVGYDEAHWDKGQTKDILAGLTKQGYTQLDPTRPPPTSPWQSGSRPPALIQHTQGRQASVPQRPSNTAEKTYLVVKLITADAAGERQVRQGHERVGDSDLRRPWALRLRP
jgi:peptidoglycan hydrolase-like protein with peptidoglycan-binding domain